MKIKIKLLKPVTLKTYTFSLNHFLILSFAGTQFFLKVPSNTLLIKKKNLLVFDSPKFSFQALFILRSFYLKILFFLKQTNFFFCKKLYLKGLGFKVISIEQNNVIVLKLGFSHFVQIKIPSKDQLTIYTNKNLILIEGLQKEKVGNFANKIKSFRLPDSYKGKGIWYKNETKILKEVKKT
jgi:ribosomal protein L6P/L9E